MPRAGQIEIFRSVRSARGKPRQTRMSRAGQIDIYMLAVFSHLIANESKSIYKAMFTRYGVVIAANNQRRGASGQCVSKFLLTFLTTYSFPFQFVFLKCAAKYGLVCILEVSKFLAYREWHKCCFEEPTFFFLN